MKGYLISNYTIHDPNTYQKYAERTGRSPAAAPSQHGNRPLPRFHAPGYVIRPHTGSVTHLLAPVASAVPEPCRAGPHDARTGGGRSTKVMDERRCLHDRRPSQRSNVAFQLPLGEGL